MNIYEERQKKVLFQAAARNNNEATYFLASFMFPGLSNIPNEIEKDAVIMSYIREHSSRIDNKPSVSEDSNFNTNTLEL